jgi:hypothetical protein
MQRRRWRSARTITDDEPSHADDPGTLHSAQPIDRKGASPPPLGRAGPFTPPRVASRDLPRHAIAAADRAPRSAR